MQKLVSFLRAKSLIIILFITLCSFTAYKYAIGRNDVIFTVLLGTLADHHYTSVKMDDAFSEKVYDLYMRNLDGQKKFLLQEDVEKLAKYRREIDDQISNHRQEFYKLSVELITTRVNEKKEWAKEILANPIDFAAEDEYETEGKKLAFAKTQDELKAEWGTDAQVPGTGEN
jgi:carboxyl-terminal processing protease